MGFRGKQILLLTVVTAAVALSTCVLNAALLARSRVERMREDTTVTAMTFYHVASGAIRRSSGSDLAEILRQDPGLRDYTDGVLGYSTATFYMAVVDREGTVLFHNDPRHQGTEQPEARSIDAFAAQSVFRILWQLWHDDRMLVAEVPFSLDGEEPFGSMQVGVLPAFLRAPLFRAVAVNAAIASAATLLVLVGSFVLANRFLAPLDRLREELSKLPVAKGEPPLDLSRSEDVGRVAQFFASVSERLQADPSPEPGDGLLPAMLDGISEAVIVLDGDLRVLSLNARARALLDLESGSGEGEKIESRVAADHPVAAIIRDAMASDTDVLRRPCVLVRDGEEVPHAISAHLLRKGEARAGLMITIRDLAKLSRIASRLSYSQKLTALGRLTSGVAHEIKNPLNAMQMQSALLRKKLADEDESLERHLDILDGEIHRLDRVVLGFLAFTRPDKLRLEAVDLERVVRAAADKVYGDAEAAGIHVEFDVAEALPDVPGDAALLDQVFCNLLANAREAMPGGGSVRICLQPDEDGVRVTVTDTGTGIPEESIPKIFGLYFTTKERGSGIGLSVVYRIVQLHGGEVNVRSQPGEGTTMEVLLPEIPE